MTSWVAWVVFVVVAVALGIIASYFSVRRVRWATAVIAAALVIMVTSYGLNRAQSLGMPPSGPPDLQTAFAKGADAIAAALFRPLWMSHAVPEPGRVGWVILAGLILIGYRQLEAWAYAKQAPVLDTSHLADSQPSIPADPTSVPGSSEPGSSGPGSGTPAGSALLTDGQRHDQLAAELQFRIAAMEVRSPAILPGGSRSGGLASIAEDSGFVGGDLAGAIIRFLSLLWPGPRRWTLRVWVEPPAAGDAEAGTRVTVELDDPRTGGTVATKTVAAATLDEAASMTAGYVARQVFADDPATPPWSYGASDGRDLGAMLIARQARVYVENSDAIRKSRQEQIRVLQTVTGGNRCAGLVRYELAQLHDLGTNHLTALRLHAVNREQYPRFFRGRYRLAMSLEMAANPALTFSNPQAVRYMLSEVVAILHRCGLAMRTSCEEADIVPAPAEHGRYRIADGLGLVLLEAARSEVRVVERQLRLPVLLWAALVRRDERSVWRPHRRLRVRQSFRDGACVAGLLVAVRVILNDPGQLSRLRHSRYQRALRIAAAVTGDSIPIEALFSPRAGAVQAGTAQAGAVQAGTGQAGTVQAAPVLIAPPERVRLLPWQRRTASWQAAYNTACIYSALVQHGLASEDRVVTSLQRAIDSRDSEMERPYDWIAYDPDFVPLKESARGQYPEFKKFLRDQKRRDYPRRPRLATDDEDEGEGGD